MIYTTPEQMKYIESISDDTALSYTQLMDNAALHVTQLISIIMNEIDISEGIVIICGHGNNGADGLTIAKNLTAYNIKITVVLADGDPSTEIAMFRYCELSDEKNVEVLSLNDNIKKVFRRFSSAAIIVDAVYGIGFNGGSLPPAIKACFDFAKRCNAIKIAVDIPSGANALDGTVDENIMKFDYTVTFGYEKTGMLLSPLRDYCGEIIVADIGFTEEMNEGIEYLTEAVTDKMVAEMFPERKSDSHKGDFGRLMNVSGSRCMSGAAALSTLAALRSGAGLVRLASTEKVIDRLASSIFEAIYLPLKEDKDGIISSKNIPDLLKAAETMTAVSIGSGLTVTESTKNIVTEMLKNIECPIILDADGINCLADNIDIIKNTKNKLIITPHKVELLRLIKASGIDSTYDRYSSAVALAKTYGIIVVAKGSPNFIVGEGKAYMCATGNPGLSKGGSGDVLTGIIAGFVAQGLNPLDAAIAGVYVHGLAADNVAAKTSKIGMLPYDVINELPFVFGKWNR